MPLGKLEAFPGDRYIANLKTAAKASRPWVRVLWVAVIVSAFADFYIMWDLLAQLTNCPGPDSTLSQIVGDPQGPFVTCALVASYILLGRVVGNKAAEYKAFRTTSSLAITLISLVFEALTLVAVTVLRFLGVMKHHLGNDFDENIMAAFNAFSSDGISAAVDSLGKYAVTASIEALVFASVMALGAVLSMVASYYGSDPVSSEKYRSAKSHIHQDYQAYEKTYFQYAANPEKDRGYEEQEQRLDREMVTAVFELSSIASQLNGVMDPADAQEFRQVNSVVSRDWFRADSREA